MALAMVMGMDIMGRRKSQAKPLPTRKTEKSGLGLLLMFGLLPSASAKVFDISLTPTLTASQTYSDNLTLQPSSRAQEGFVTELAPSLGMSRSSAAWKFNFNARLQYVLYEGIDIGSRLYPQLQMSSQTELVDDSLFIDSSATIGQGNAGAIGGINTSNLYPSQVGSTTYRTFRLSPYWRPHLGGYAEGEARFTYSVFGNSGSGNSINGIGNLGSDSFAETIYLHDGKRLASTGLTWRLNANNQDQLYAQSKTSRINFRSVNGEVSQRLTNDISFLVQAGYYGNTYPSTVSTNNGSYITPGLSWTPSPNFSLAGGYGINAQFVNVTWHPSQRTSFELGYRDSKVGGSAYGAGMLGFGGAGAFGDAGAAVYGVGTGQAGTGNYPSGNLGAPNAGVTWNGSLRHQTRTTSWTASYYTTTTTIQQLLTNLPTYTTPTDLNGNPIGDPTANGRPINLPNLTNDLIMSKRASASVSWLLSRSSLSLNVYHNDISYSSTPNRSQNILGITGTWTWHFSPRTSATLSGSWQYSDYPGSAVANTNSGRTEYMSASLSINRQMSPSVMGLLQFSHYETNSNNLVNTANILGGYGSYDSNRVIASLSVTF